MCGTTGTSTLVTFIFAAYDPGTTATINSQPACIAQTVTGTTTAITPPPPVTVISVVDQGGNTCLWTFSGPIEISGTDCSGLWVRLIVGNIYVDHPTSNSLLVYYPAGGGAGDNWNIDRQPTLIVNPVAISTGFVA